MRIELAPAAGEPADWSFRPGQYLTLESGPADHPQWRCYSIFTLADSAAPICLLVRRVRGGLVSNWLCDHLRTGDTLKALPPAGRFVLRRNDVPQIRLFAGGSGIAPIYALCRQALEEGARHVELFYANRTRASGMLTEALDQLKEKYPQRFHLRYWYDEERGLPSAADFFPASTPLPDLDVYICGPAPFMDAVAQAADVAGVPAGHVHQESFATDDGVPDASQDDRQVALLVTLKGGRHEISVGSRETLLAAMLRAGLPAPHACKVGECASCMCRLQSGAVQRLENDVLDEDDEADGWILACRTRPCGEAIDIRFP